MSWCLGSPCSPVMCVPVYQLCKAEVCGTVFISLNWAKLSLHAVFLILSGVMLCPIPFLTLQAFGTVWEPCLGCGLLKCTTYWGLLERSKCSGMLRCGS